MTHSLDFVLTRTAALETRCDYCHAAPDELCRDKRTGRIIEHQAAHYVRLQRRPTRTSTDEQLTIEQQRRAQAEAELAAIQPQLPDETETW